MFLFLQMRLIFDLLLCNCIIIKIEIFSFISRFNSLSIKMSDTSKCSAEVGYVPSDGMYCCITGEIMIDPVLSPSSGVSFERSALEEWLDDKEEDPLTRERLTKDMLVPNVSLRKSIDEIRHKIPENLMAKTTFGRDKVEKSISNDELFPLLRISTRVVDSELLVSIVATSDENKIPLKDIIWLIDVSGSMGENTSGKDANGKFESTNFTRLDLVRQACTAGIESMNEKIRLSIIEFDHEPRVLINPLIMDSIGKSVAKGKISEIRPKGSTNIWLGIEKCFELVKANHIDDIGTTKISLFTDGRSGTRVRSEAESMTRYAEKNGGIPCPVDFIGFGHDIDHDSGYSVAKVSGGLPYYISDASMVGGVFGSKMPLDIKSITYNARMYIEIDKENVSIDINELERRGFAPVIEDSSTISILTGPLIVGQCRNLRFTMSESDVDINKIEVILKTKDLVFNTLDKFEDLDPRYDGSRLDWDNNKFKWEAMDVIQSVDLLMSERRFEDARKLFNKFMSNNKIEFSSVLANVFPGWKKGNSSKSEFVTKLMDDLSREVNLSLDPTANNVWGKYYRPTIISAHYKEYSSNQKDSAMQMYNGRIYSKCREDVFDIFEKTPCVASGASILERGGTRQPQAMSAAFHVSAGCFDGSSTVEIINPLTDVNGFNDSSSSPQIVKVDKIRVDCVKPGDKLLTVTDGVKSYSKVEKILVTKIGYPINMVKLNEGWIGTPNHPVFWENENGLKEWIHPKNIECIDGPKSFDTPAIYSFLFEKRSKSVVVGGIESATLAHGLHDNVIEHDFFGTEKVVKCMEKISNVMGYHGVVTVEPEWFQRDNDGMVCDIKPSESNARMEKLLAIKSWHLKNVFRSVQLQHGDLVVS